MPSQDRTASPSGPDVAFWQTRFETGATPWDRGAINPQLETWVAAGRLDPARQADAPTAASEGARPTRVLVPGCGSGYEVAMLAQAGFDVTAVDYAPTAVEQTQDRLRVLLGTAAGARLVRAEVVEADLLTYAPAGKFDAIYEQTCLCALYPDHWRRYADNLWDWLRPGGSLFALFMQSPRDSLRGGFIEGPPYHCDINAMRALFPAGQWEWPKPPYPAVAHPTGAAELAVVLARR